MIPLFDRQHDAFDNPAKMACREGNLRVLVYRGSVRGQRMANLRIILR
jgi:hypothetical protein